MISELTSIRMIANESVDEYNSRAEELIYNLDEVGESLSEKISVCIILKDISQ